LRLGNQLRKSRAVPHFSQDISEENDMKASLRPALFVMGAVTVCGLAGYKTANASSAINTFTEAAKDGGASVELASKDGGMVIELGGKDAGAVIELGGKDAGAVELADFVKGGKDAGSITAEKGDAGK